MAKYKANPVVVDAWKIKEVGKPSSILDPADVVRILVLEDDFTIQVDAGMLARMTPVVGDYVVEQSDGYVYLNPKDVFERKYSLVE